MALALTALIVPTFAGTAGATMGCGEYSFGFDGTRLLNDGISNSAGPFAIELPAGTYDVIMQSHDAHDEHPGQTEQTEEQWFFVLDSGYESPLTVDVPDDQNHSVTVVENQTIATSSAAITVNHRGVGSINSVDVVCVGFTPVAVPVTPIAPEEPIDETPEVEESVVAPPVVDDEGPPPEPEAEPPVEVAGAVAEPPAQLALTGPTRVTYWLVGSAVAMFATGAGLSTIERRRKS